MTAIEACQILNVPPGSSIGEIQRAYLAKLQALQLKLVPGQGLATREKAQREIAQLKTAFEAMKNGTAGPAQPIPTAGPACPGPLPMRGPTWQPARPPGMSTPGAAYPLGNRAVLLGLAMTAAITAVVVLLCAGTPVSTGKPPAGHMRVLSAPWCDVYVDGSSLGPSGQAQPFEISAGDHHLVLRRSDRSLARTIQVSTGGETLIKVQFEKGNVDVIQKQD